MAGSLGSSWGLGNRQGVWLLQVDNQHPGGTHPRSREVPCQGLGFLGAHRLLALGVLPSSCLDAVGGQGVHQAAVHLACHPC